MDLHIVGAEPTAEERAAVDAVLGAPVSGWFGAARETARDGRGAHGGRRAWSDRDRLLPALHAVQDGIGWISRGALNYICRRLSVPPAEAWGVVTFYHLLATEPQPRVIAHVCDDIACRLHGAEEICRDLAAGDVATDPLGPAWRRSPCLGQCDRAPAALLLAAGRPALRRELTQVTTAAAIRDAIARAQAPAAGTAPTAPVEPAAPAPRRLLQRIGAVDPSSLDDYRAGGGYRALVRAVELGRDGVIAEVTSSNLLGRGGAAFPTGRKWAAVAAEAAAPHYVVCNADESEPGTFKDRVLLTEDPFAIVEAMTICGYATGSEQGFLYVRGEYPLAEARMAHAVAAAREARLLGEDVAIGGFRFDIEIRRGAGAYICGEETALFNSIEGRRGEPRSKPPFPAQAGLFGKPTVVNNVETLANVLEIVLQGGDAWAGVGTKVSAGTRLFCVSGQVERPGLYEAPFGTTLRAIVTRAGGVAGGRALRGILLGGAAGVFVGPDRLDLPLTFEDARAAGVTLGSGVVMVFDETADLAGALARIAEFFAHESCGQCVPCRVGTVRQREILARLAARPASGAGDRALIAELGQAMRDASICGLGQTASSAIESAIANLPVFRDERPAGRQGGER